MSVTERRQADRRHESRTMAGTPADHPPAPSTRSDERDAQVRENPEVMGRTEPRAMELQDPMAPVESQPVERHRSDMWPDMSEFQLRFQEIQSEFIDDPKAAVQKAERLMQEAIDHLTKSMQERSRAMHRDTDGKGDTEQLRVTMRMYREFIQSLGGNRAA